MATKHGVPFPTLRDKAAAEGWVKDRETARDKAVTAAVQHVVSVAAQNAETAQRIRGKLLARLEREIDALPDSTGTLSRQSVVSRENLGRGGTKTKDATKEYKLRDLTAMWKDLTEGMIAPAVEESNDDGFIAALGGTATEDWNDAE